MEITTTQQTSRVSVTVVHIKGDIDSTTVKHTQAKIEKVVEAGARDLVLDLTEVGYLSSAGIRMLSSLFNLLRGTPPPESDPDGMLKSPHLKLVSSTPRVTDVLKISGLDLILDYYGNVAQAVASF